MSHTTTLTISPAEEGTAIVTASFTDENGAAEIPNAGTLTWTLTDRHGRVINDREDVAIASAASVVVILTGDDLAIGEYGLNRVITFEGLYNSTLGNNLPIKIRGHFSITDFEAVPDA